tara:strand:+ start:190 stop:903 length:714 start_codon:yes stop_codon:yes gene_type:complete
MLEETDIEKIYDQHIKVNYTEEYKNRYHPLPLERNNKNWRWEGKDFPRVISLLEFERYVQKYNFQIKKLLLLNAEWHGSEPEVEYLTGRYKSVLGINYSDNPEKYDLHRLQIKHKDFDFVMLNQTLEHVYNPYTCLTNIKKHMVKDGYLYINVPACNIPHSEPFHFYTGYTPMGLAALAHETGYEILEIGQWGNKEYLGRLFGITGERWWAEYNMLNAPGINEIENPVITWGLFKVK